MDFDNLDKLFDENYDEALADYNREQRLLQDEVPLDLSNDDCESCTI